MMETKHLLLRGVFLSVGAAVLALFLQACPFHHGAVEICRLIEGRPLTPASTPPPSLVFEDPGTIKVMHGSACAHINKGPYMKVEQSLNIPDYANKAAVFLNGWKLKYSGGDHHVMAMSTVLGKIKVEPKNLTLQAVGALTDVGQDKAFDCFYYYIVIVLNDVNFTSFVN